MKHILLAIFVVLTAHLACSQQTKFENFSDKIDGFETFYLSYYKGKTIDTLAIVPGTEHFAFSFSLDPESSDEVKEEFIQKILHTLEYISTYNIPFKAFSFQIGEQIFLTQQEVKKCKGSYKKMEALNMKNAWKHLSPFLLKTYPTTVFYGENWGW